MYIKLLSLLLLFLVATQSTPSFAESSSEEVLRERLTQAEQQLEQATQDIASLSRELATMKVNRPGPHHQIMRRHAGMMGSRAVLGIAIGQESDIDGIIIEHVGSESPAAKAGLEVGDIIVAIDDVQLSGEESAATLMTHMSSKEPGDVVLLSVDRDGARSQFEVTSEEHDGPMAFRFEIDDEDFDFDFEAFADGIAEEFKSGDGRRIIKKIFRHPRAFRGIELVPLSPALGEYFSTSEGLLVVKAPKDNIWQIQEGDVILKVNGEVPNHPFEAVGILRGVKIGDRVVIDIMRQKQNQTLDIIVPDSTS